MKKTTINENDINNIIEMIKNNDVCGLIAPTGSGKSTYFVKNMFLQNCRIFVVNPTIPSVENIYKFMKTQLGNDNVGSAYEGNINYKNKVLEKIRNNKDTDIDDTKVVYCTAGHMRKIFLNLMEYFNQKENKIDLCFCDILMLDESHNGTLDLDIIMALWKLARDCGAKIPKLLLTSATLDIKKTIFPNANTYVIKLDSFPIKINYHTKNYEPDSKDIYKDLANVIIDNHIQNKNINGEILLVFCPGSGEVDSVCSNLLNVPNLIVTSLYSSQNNREADIFEIPEPGIRKIIVSTNIAETSITINNLSGVYDTMVEKFIETSSSGGYKLKISNESKSSATQRAGRTGRTCEGFVYRMCTEDFYNNLISQRPNEIDRIPLHNTIIELLNIGINPVELFESIALEKIKKSEELLLELNMITINPMATTNKGIFSCKFPLSIYASATLFEWLHYDYNIYVGICIVSLIDCFGQSYFYYPKKDILQSKKEYDILINKHYNSYFLKYNAENYIEVLINIFNDLFLFVEGDLKNINKIIEYNKINSLNNKKILEVINIISQCCNVFLKDKISIKKGPFNSKNAYEKMLPILKKVYEKKIFQFYKKTNNLIYLKDKEEYILDKRVKINKDSINHKKILGILSSEVQNKINELPKKYISFYLPI